MSSSISVIIPTFNRSAVLRQAMASVLSQKGPSFELIVVDDGSTDDTRQMIAQNYPQVRYVYQANQGPAAARNRGVDEAQGRWIAFLDSDDRWLPGKLVAQNYFFEAYPEYRIAQTEEIWIRKGRRVNQMNKHKKKGGHIFEACLPLCLISPSAVMMEKSLFIEAGRFDESYPACEDYELWLRIASRYPVGLIPKPYIEKYGGHADQLSHAFPAMDRFRIRALQTLLMSGRLSESQALSAWVEFLRKSNIYTQGALKRGLPNEAADMQGVVQSIVIYLSKCYPQSDWEISPLSSFLAEKEK